MRTSHSRQEKPELLIVDTKRVRQAGIIRLLETWADFMGFTVNAVLPDTLPGSTNCEMIIVSVGSTSIEDAQCHILIDNVRKLMPRAALIIISDREDLQEVCAAFQQGASGFMPTSIEPALGFQALSFIRSGGSFFPPSVLSTCLGEVTVLSPVRDSVLTIKQEEVFGLLRQGFPNKVIARRLGMSEATVKVHTRHIMHKFGARNRTQLALAAMNDSRLLNDNSNADRIARDQVSEASPQSASSRARE
jgi:two-component system, NarL family, nitrate/nitrite response regulator NarL